MDTSETSESGRREPARAGTLRLIARAAAHDRISAALRAARSRAALDEQQVVDLLRARGVSITTATLERWERTGGIRLEEAVDLAAIYHMTIDELAGRRAWHSRFLGTVERARLDPLWEVTGLAIGGDIGGAFRIATRCVHPRVAYLVECRTSSIAAGFDAARLAVQVLESLQRSQVVREPDIALDPRTRSLTMSARIETAQTPQLAAVIAANELLWRTNQYCGSDAAAHVKITHLVSRLAGS